MNTLSRVEKCKINALALLIAISCFGVMSLVTLWDIKGEQTEEAEQMLAFVDKVHSHDTKIVSALDKFSVNGCSEAHQEAMHELLDAQIFIRAISYNDEEGSQCSTAINAQNILNNSIILTPSNLPNGNTKIIANTQEAPSYITARHNNYLLSYPINISEHFLLLNARYELVFVGDGDGDGEIQHIYGNKKLYSGTVGGLFTWTENGDFAVEQCSAVSSFCVSFAHSTKELFDEFVDVASALLLCCAVIFWFVRRKLIKQFLKRSTITERIKSGLCKDRFYPLFQPIVCMQTQRVIGCEVLARFKDEYGEVYPDQFISVIRELGQTWNFTEKLVKKSADILSKESHLPDNFHVNINVFPEDIANDNIANLNELAVIRRSRFNWVIEITEDQSLEHKAAQQNLVAMYQRGINIAIDDFGTGYSNLQHITKIRCQYLKIDRSFIKELEVGSVRSSLIPNIVEIAQKNGLKIVAEGIENEQQYKILRAMQIELGQGWLFAKAIPAKELASAMVCIEKAL